MIFALILIVATLLPAPDWPLPIAAGYVYGFWAFALTFTPASAFASVLAFLAARYMLRDKIQSLLTPREPFLSRLVRLTVAGHRDSEVKRRAVDGRVTFLGSPLVWLKGDVGSCCRLLAPQLWSLALFRRLRLTLPAPARGSGEKPATKAGNRWFARLPLEKAG